MSKHERDYDSTIARIAGNILSNTHPKVVDRADIAAAVWVARQIVKEVQTTEPVIVEKREAVTA